MKYSRTIAVTEHGFVEYKDHMGDDEAIAEAARCYHTGKQTWQRLNRFMMRNDHTSPFEHCIIKFHIKAPIVPVARQMVRHRTASWNEISFRYLEIDEKFDFYIPAARDINEQSTSSLQGRSQSLVSHDTAEFVRQAMLDNANASLALYREMIERGVAREIARNVIAPYIYTEWVWTIDLHNLMHFLKLRLSEHAQLETRMYARAIAIIFADLFPHTHEAFMEYKMKEM